MPCYMPQHRSGLYSSRASIHVRTPHIPCQPHRPCHHADQDTTQAMPCHFRRLHDTSGNYTGYAMTLQDTTEVKALLYDRGKDNAHGGSGHNTGQATTTQVMQPGRSYNHIGHTTAQVTCTA